MWESFVWVFCLLVFLMGVVSLGTGDAGSSALLGFFGVGAFGRSFVFWGVSPFFCFWMT